MLVHNKHMTLQPGAIGHGVGVSSDGQLVVPRDPA